MVPMKITGLSLPLVDDALAAEGSKGKLLVEPSPWNDVYLQFSDLANLPRSKDVFRKNEMDSKLSLWLPKVGSTAGRVVEHSVRVFETLKAQHEPMTFKFGITHDAAVRWHNTRFGYRYSKDPFDFMVIIYAASNPHGPAFLEAMLIDRFGSFLFAKPVHFTNVMFFFVQSIAVFLNTLTHPTWLYWKPRLARLQKRSTGRRHLEGCGFWTISDLHRLQELETTKHASEKWGPSCVVHLRHFTSLSWFPFRFGLL